MSVVGRVRRSSRRGRCTLCRSTSFSKSVDELHTGIDDGGDGRCRCATRLRFWRRKYCGIRYTDPVARRSNS
eukprot:1190761-Prorocentrum_minimum.AAC.2